MKENKEVLKTRIIKKTQGVNFCGYKINSNVIKIRNSSKYRMKRKLKGYTKIVAYYGTSTYDTKEMSRFLDEIVSEAKELGIQVETPEQIAEMKSLWSSYEK